MDKYTLFLTTINRVKELEIFLKYYEQQKIKCPIIIGDSSTKSNFIKIKKLIKNSKLKNIKIFNIPNINQINFFKFLLKKVKTKYAIYSGDDDYYDLSLIEKEIKQINKKKIINLKSYALELVDYKYDHLTFGYSKEILHEDPQIRLNELRENYYSLMFSLTSTQNWLKAINYALKFKSKVISSEIAICFKLVELAKVHQSNSFCLLRTYEPKNKIIINKLRNKVDNQETYQVELYKLLLDFNFNHQNLGNFLQFENLDISRKIKSSLSEYYERKNYQLSENFNKLLNYYSFGQFKNISQTDLIYWGNYSNFELCFQNYIKKKLYSKKIILLTPRDTNKYVEFFKKNKIECFVLHVDEYNQFESYDKNIFILRSLRGCIKNYFSISNFLPLEKLLLTFCNPKNKFIYWAHITNYLNHPLYTNSIIKSDYFPNNIKFTFIKFIYQLYILYRKNIIFLYMGNDSKYVKNLIKKIIESKTSIIEENSAEISKLHKNSSKVFDKMKFIIRSHKFNRYVNFKLFLPIKKTIFLFLKVIDLFLKVIDLIISRVRRKRNPEQNLVKILQIKNFNIQKFLYDFIKFDYNNVDEPYVRTDTFYMRYVGENLFLNAFRKLNLLKSEKERLSQIKIHNFEINHIDYINQLGKVKGLNLYLITDLEISILKKIYGKDARLNFTKMKFPSSAGALDNNKNGLITFSVGLIPENNFEISKLAKELRFLMNKYNIKNLYLRPHPAEDIDKIKFFINKFKAKHKIEIILHKNNLPFFQDQKKFKALFTSISATLVELSEKRKSNVCLSSTVSSKQYSDLKLFNKFFPEIEII